MKGRDTGCEGGFVLPDSAGLFTGSDWIATRRQDGEVGPSAGETRNVSRAQFLKMSGLLAVTGTLGTFSAESTAYAQSGYPDAFTHETMSHLNDWLAWLGPHHGFVGEVGIPSNLGKARNQFYPDERRWRQLGSYWYKKADAAGLWVTAQEVSEQYYDVSNGGYYASLYLCPGDHVHKVISRQSYQSPLLASHEQFRGAGRGVNFSGGQKFDEGPQNNRHPGTYNKDYWYPTVNSHPRDPNTGRNSFHYLASQGVKQVRIGFRWERMQPTLHGPLDATELARYKRCVDNARGAGIQVIIDCHNYGGYVTPAGRQPLNSPGCPVSAFIDLWKKLSHEFRDVKAVSAYDLMNEPYNHGGIKPGSYSSPAKAWEAITQRVVNAIRARGDKKRIMVPTYANVQRTPRIHRRPWIKHGGSHRYASHHYWDHYTGSDTGGGNFVRSYAQENDISRSRGY